MKLTTLTVSTAFILIVATLLNIGELYSMAGMLAALPLVCYFVGRRQNGGVQAERLLETVGMPGRSLQVTLKLKNQDSWPKRNLLIQDHLPRWLQRDRDARPILAPLPGGGTETVIYHLRPEKRGCYPVGPLEVVATDPLGIFHFRHEIAGTSELLVYPTTLETAAAVAASLARLVLERGNRCRLAIPGVLVPRLADSRGTDALYGILDALARVEAEQSETAADAVAALLPELERNATLTLVTSVWDEASTQAVTAAANA